jgi:hypothetical protein
MQINKFLTIETKSRFGFFLIYRDLILINTLLNIVIFYTNYMIDCVKPLILGVDSLKNFSHLILVMF